MRLLPDKKLAIRKPSGGWRMFDLAPIYEAEDRIPEVATVTPHKAPELMSFFNRVWLKADEIIRFLDVELLDAKQAVTQKRAEIILDRCEPIFELKGLRASADLRQAVVDNDPEYKVVMDVQNSLEAAVAFLKGKQRGIQMAFDSVRKILGESTYNMRNSSNNQGNVEKRAEDLRAAFGRYNYEE